MSQFFESIRVVNGRIMNLKEHQIRVNLSLGNSLIQLNTFIKSIEIPQKGVYKLRIQYNSKSNNITGHSITKYKENPIYSLRRINVNFLNYQFKYEDREELNKLYNKRKSYDDILIINNNKVTDTWYCNIAFYNGQEWHTPQDCLLKGTMRSKLIKKGIIKEVEIHSSNIHSYKKARLFNAMIPWSKKKEISINNIY